MSMQELRSVLRQAASMLDAAGAKNQAQAVATVEEVIADSGDETVGEFVAKTQAALNRQQLHELPPDQILAILDEIKTDKVRFAEVFAAMEKREFQKGTVIAVASLFTGARPTAWSTKPQALKAIKRKFDDRVYMASKDAMNSKVTPW